MRTTNTWKERYDLEEDGKNCLTVVMGDKNLVFNLGNHSCGEATCYGMAVSKQGEAGGVIPLDEVVRLRDFINKHIKMALDGEV